MNKEITPGKISFLVPVFNERENIPVLCHRLRDAMEKIPIASFEILFVDDCSTDDTLRVLQDLHAQDSRVKILSLSRNFGHQAALTAGLKHVSGDCAIILDGDLQDPPELATQLLEKWKQGFQVVFGVRKTRQEGWLLQLAYHSFYRLLKFLSPLEIPLDSGDFCLLDRGVIDELNRLSEDRPFVRGLRAWVGFSQTALEYDRSARNAGEAKYDFFRLSALAFDGLISFSDKTLRVSGFLGFILSCLSIFYAVLMLVMRILIYFGLASGDRLVRGWTTVVCSVMFLLGLQFIFLGILGEYVGRIFHQTKGRPLFIVKEKIGFS